MRRHDFTPLFLLLVLILGLALFWSCRVFAHITPEDDARLEAAAGALLGAYNAVQDIRQEGGQVPPPPVSDKQDWQCYLDRYDDVRRNGAYTAGWANRHYANWGQREGRIWGCTQIVDPRPPSSKLPWHHSNQSGSFGTSVNLCEQYDATAVSLDGTEWRYHRRDKGREVWYDPQKRDGMSGTITVELESGQVITAELAPGTGIRYSGDC